MLRMLKGFAIDGARLRRFGEHKVFVNSYGTGSHILQRSLFNGQNLIFQLLIKLSVDNAN
jgi:hypothetical protein